MTYKLDPLVIGKINGVFGVHGWVRVFDFSQKRGDILNYSSWLLSDENKWAQHRLVSGQVHGKRVIAKIEGFDDRDQALLLIGKNIAVREDWLTAPSVGQYYWYQLQGLEVINLQNEYLGRVDHLLETGANDVLVLSGDRQRLIPFVPDVVSNVDIENKKIIVDWDKNF